MGTSDSDLFHVSLFYLRPARYLVIGTPFAAEEATHTFHIITVVRSTLGSGTAKRKYRVKGLFAVGAIEQVLFEDSMH